MKLSRYALAALLVVALGGAAVLSTGCGSKAATEPAATETQQPATSESATGQVETTAAAPADTGKIEIKEIKAGSGPAAKAGDSVLVDYTGSFTDGKEFDSSVGKEPLPVTLGANQVIPGFEQGITGMKVGGERQVTIPPSLGYGAQGAGGVIPPNATLVFDIKLVKIQ